MMQYELRLCYNRLKAKDIKALEDFYVFMMGMKVIDKVKADGQVTSFLGYDDAPRQGALLELTQAKVSQAGLGGEEKNLGPDSVYWKIGVAVPDVDLAVERLRSKNLGVTDPVMIQDVGYLCHMDDLEHFHTEFMQMTFTSPRLTRDPDLPLGQKVTLNVITTRTQNIQKSLRFYQAILGMKLVCYQNQKSYGFDVYYLAFTTETPPDPDPGAIVNSEWTYQRPYTLLEIISYLEKKVEPFQQLQEGDTGFGGIGIVTSDLQAVKSLLLSHNVLMQEEIQADPVLHGKPSFTVRDPDGIPVRFSSA